MTWKNIFQSMPGTMFHMDPLLACIIFTLDAMHTERHSGALHTELCKETQI